MSKTAAAVSRTPPLPSRTVVHDAARTPRSARRAASGPSRDAYARRPHAPLEGSTPAAAASAVVRYASAWQRGGENTSGSV